MYHLCIDSGNTNIVFAVFDGKTMLGSWRMTTDVNRTADELAVWLIQLFSLQNIDRSKISGAIIANVVPQTGHALYKLCETYFGIRPLHVAPDQIELGLNILVDHPDEVGADRLVNAVAVMDQYPLPAVVIDFGTATTFDVIDHEGAYLGGAICPGINLSLNALVEATAKLPRIAVARPKRAIGKSTVEAMQSGVYWGYVGLIEGVLQKIQAEYGQKLNVIATGGLANFFADVIPGLHAVNKDLTLQGLSKLYLSKEKNTHNVKNIRQARVKSAP